MTAETFDHIAGRFSRYLTAQMDGVSNVTATITGRIHGGASRETYRVLVDYTEHGIPQQRNLILRRDPPSSLIETERDVEFDAYRAYVDTPVPVPEALFLERETQWLDRPFFVMEEITGCQAGSVFQPEPYGPHRQKLGEQFWRILGEIHRPDPAALGLTDTLDPVTPDTCWQRELDYWEGVIDEDALEPQPIVRAAIRWLRRTPPPPAQQITVVHGDYRSGNFLFDDTGALRAVLDWEMCHLGDPLEDVCWAADPLWAAPGDHPAALIPLDEGLAIWEEASGLRADPDGLGWWRVFAAVKGMAIWISAAREFASGTNMDPVLAFSGWYTAQRHNEILVDYMRTALEAA